MSEGTGCSLTVRPLPDPVRRAPVLLPAGFPQTEKIAAFATDRVREDRARP
ncbi:hypothetical protein ACFU6R_13170 [Streptomyces sp. NPDC057499]|uniref:hypothetical protein n=1 Tax=Streptomyces sp. NPDC057499 TaxID=3346150 RepID=UPI003693FDE3